VFFSASGSAAQGIIVDHTCTNLTAIPQMAIEAAKADLHIAYGHTSHGSQVTSGMDVLMDLDGDGQPDGSQNASIAADRQPVTLQVRDGGHGDADGVANGIVVDPSGPASLSSPANPAASIGDGGGGCYIDVTLNR
jgi:hypothetical protein